MAELLDKPRTLHHDFEALRGVLEGLDGDFAANRSRIEITVESPTLIVAQMMSDRLPRPIVGTGKTIPLAIRDLLDECVRLSAAKRGRR